MSEIFKEGSFKCGFLPRSHGIRVADHVGRRVREHRSRACGFKALANAVADKIRMGCNVLTVIRSVGSRIDSVIEVVRGVAECAIHELPDGLKAATAAGPTRFVDSRC